MLKDFIYDIPTKVYFGQGYLSELPKELKLCGNRVLLTYGGGSIKKTGLYDKIMTLLNEAGLEVYELSGIEPNPRITSVAKGADLCKDHDIDVILAVGGGSVIDASKLMCAGRYFTGDDYWDLVKKKAPIEKALPLITVLTIAATGSEMDPGGVITNLDTREKLGRSDPKMQPKVSFLDPTNTYSVSAYQTACGSADILSHIFEVYFAREEGMYMLDKFLEGLMKTVIKYAPIALQEPDNYEARANLMWASSWAINNFARIDKLHKWSCHPLEHELSAFYDITHGLGLAILTPRWMRHVLNENTIDAFVKFGVEVFEIDYSLPKDVIAKEAIHSLEDFLYKDLGLTSTLSELNIDDEYFEVMAKRVTQNGPIKGFVDLNYEDCLAIYKESL